MIAHAARVHIFFLLATLGLIGNQLEFVQEYKRWLVACAGRLGVAVTGELRMAVKPLGPGFFPDADVGRNVVTLGRGFAQLSEVVGVVAEIDQGVFVPSARLSVERIIIDAGLV